MRTTQSIYGDILVKINELQMVKWEKIMNTPQGEKLTVVREKMDCYQQAQTLFAARSDVNFSVEFERLPAFSQNMRDYINLFDQKPLLAVQAHQLDAFITTEERRILNQYRDPWSNILVNIPVRFRGKNHDLLSLLACRPIAELLGAFLVSDRPYDAASMRKEYEHPIENITFDITTEIQPNIPLLKEIQRILTKAQAQADREARLVSQTFQSRFLSFSKSKMDVTEKKSCVIM